MSQATRYHVAEGLTFFSEAFGLDPRRGLKRAGLPADFLTAAPRSVTAAEYYDLWEALEAEMSSADLPERMARLLTEGGSDSAVYAFYSSPDVRTGLERKALFKPLVMPLTMRVSDYDAHLVLSFGSPLPDRPLPSLIGWFDLTYFLLAIRHATGHHVVPAAIEVGAARPGWDASALFGCVIREGTSYRMVLTAEDASRPLVTRNDALWVELERGLQERFACAVPERSSAARVRQALVEGLPGGQVTADQIARSLAMSKRSLQRRLEQEGLSFKEILEDTRRALALSYLQNSEMSMQEIALLLGFRDPSSFFRAFRTWTGRTPHSVRRALA